MNSMSDDRDTLSAFFDGELRDDAARFAARRLGHDADWRGSLERWQLIGDVLRGQASMLAPAGFAERVAGAIAGPTESAQEQGTATPRALPTASRRRGLWSGMALAASIAAVAALVMPSMREDLQPQSPSVVAASTPQGGPQPLSADVDSAGVSSASARTPARRVRSASARVARARASTRSVATHPARTKVRPFQPPVEDSISSRPWPRATLPGMQAGSALTASYSGTDGDGPTFYPFEPDAQGDAATPAPFP